MLQLVQQQSQFLWVLASSYYYGVRWFSCCGLPNQSIPKQRAMLSGAICSAFGGGQVSRIHGHLHNNTKQPNMYIHPCNCAYLHVFPTSHMYKHLVEGRQVGRYVGFMATYIHATKQPNMYIRTSMQLCIYLHVFPTSHMYKYLVEGGQVDRQVGFMAT